MRTREIPHTAAGPSLRELVLGSEGTLGVITEVSARVRPSPRTRVYEGWIAESFQAGREIVRELAQRHEAPDILRLSEEEETRVSLELTGTEGLIYDPFADEWRLSTDTDVNYFSTAARA